MITVIAKLAVSRLHFKGLRHARQLTNVSTARLFQRKEKSKIQPSKTRRVFEKYGDVMVPWNTKGKIYERYYYIYQLEEIKKMFEKAGLKIISHKWECGNEVYVLS